MSVTILQHQQWLVPSRLCSSISVIWTPLLACLLTCFILHCLSSSAECLYLWVNVICQCLRGDLPRWHVVIATLTYRTLQSDSHHISHPSSISTLLQDFSTILHTICYMFLLPPRPLVVKPSVLQLQQFEIPFHSVSGNHHLLAPSNVISKLIYLPSPASPFSHPATPAPPTRACLNLCTIQIL